MDCSQRINMRRAPIVAKVRMKTQGSEKNIFFSEPETLRFVGSLVLNREKTVCRSEKKIADIAGIAKIES
jgi:hypothetical protein